MLDYILGESFSGFKMGLSVLIAFIFAFLSFSLLKGILPKDQGRKFAHNGALSEGKPRGAGFLLISAFIISSVLFIKLSPELICYVILIFASMITGYLDDAAEKPWGELKKGILDLLISAGAGFAFYYFNSSDIRIATLGIDVHIPAPLFIVLAAALVWGSINVTNCSDGVDGLCGTVSAITLFSALVLINRSAHDSSFEHMLLILIVSMAAYLWFNASPSKILMGDAGSRALGVMIAFAFLKSSSPLMFIPCGLVLIIDGGLGLVKLSAIRFLKIKSFMKNIRTPIHDHLRKNKGWSDTQTVYRLAILQLIVSAAFVSYAVL